MQEVLGTGLLVIGVLFFILSTTVLTVLIFTIRKSRDIKRRREISLKANCRRSK